MTSNKVIRVHRAFDNKPVYIMIDHIVSFFHDAGATFIDTTTHLKGFAHLVKETPEQVLKLITGD